MCDAGHDAGRPCGRPAVLSVGRVGICAEHLDVLRGGIEAETAAQSVYFAERYLKEGHGDASPWIEPRLAALAAEAREESQAASANLRHFLESAGDKVEDAPRDGQEE
jgi:hypothetical protein